jgi:hypothetical protein
LIFFNVRHSLAAHPDSIGHFGLRILSMTRVPSVFISYSWTSQEHMDFVMDLANKLNDAGADVTLDRWTLQPGHDPLSFMEEGVRDSDKVVIVSDSAYAAKADGRHGGVGTETQIISPNVYASSQQNKFAVVVVEKDESGKACLPTFYTSRMYIDFTVRDAWAERMEELIRWIYDKPLHVKPERGKPPSYITDRNAPVLATSGHLDRALDGLRHSRPFAHGAVQEYLSTFSDNLSRFQQAPSETPYDEVVAAIDSLQSPRNEYVTFLKTLVMYGDESAYAPVLHRFFESLIRYCAGVRRAGHQEQEHLEFFVYELFLLSIAVLVESRKLSTAVRLMDEPYFPSIDDEHAESEHSFMVFDPPMRALEARNKLLKLNRQSLAADILKKRCELTPVRFEQLMQADFICYVRNQLRAQGKGRVWWPHTLVFALLGLRKPFDFFHRIRTEADVSDALHLIGAMSIEDVGVFLSRLSAGFIAVPRWDGDKFDVSELIAFSKWKELEDKWPG